MFNSLQLVNSLFESGIDRKIGSTRFADSFDGNESLLIVNDGDTWTSGDTFDTTGSISIRDTRFHTGAQNVVYEEIQRQIIKVLKILVCESLKNA